MLNATLPIVQSFQDLERFNSLIRTDSWIGAEKKSSFFSKTWKNCDGTSFNKTLIDVTYKSKFKKSKGCPSLYLKLSGSSSKSVVRISIRLLEIKTLNSLKAYLKPDTEIDQRWPQVAKKKFSSRILNNPKRPFLPQKSWIVTVKPIKPHFVPQKY